MPPFGSVVYVLRTVLNRGRLAAMKRIEPHSPKRNRPLRVSIVAFPECDPSIMYGIFDTLWIAGANWKSSSNEPTSEVLFSPRLVAASLGL